MRLATTALAGLLALGSAASAQGLPGGQNPLDPLMHGALVYYGNYCGPGNKGIHPAPVDALDAACMRHDACTTDFELPACACNARLVRQASRIASDPRAPDRERAAAAFTARGARLLPCRR